MDRNAKILVIGATGMVGSYVVRNLISNGYNNITGSHRASSNFEHVEDFQKAIKWKSLDILNHMDVYEAIEETEVVIHTAAVVDFQGKFSHLYRVNVEGTTNVVNAALETNLEKLVYISSTAALGRKGRKNVIDENEEWEYSKFNTDYAISKYHAELEVWRGSAEGLNVTVLNPAFILGSGDWNRSSLKLIKKVDSGLLFFPHGTNGFVDVRDVAQAVNKVLEMDKPGERFIVSSENLAYRNVIQLISKDLNKKPPSFKLPYSVGYIGGKIGNLLSYILPGVFPLNMDIIRNLFSDNKYVNTKSTEELGLEYIPIKKSIKDVVEVYQNPHKNFLNL